MHIDAEKKLRKQQKKKQKKKRRNNGGNNGGKKCRVSHTHRLHYYIYVNKRGKQKTIQTIHKTLHKPYISLIFRMLQNV